MKRLRACPAVAWSGERGDAGCNVGYVLFAAAADLAEHHASLDLLHIVRLHAGAHCRLQVHNSQLQPHTADVLLQTHSVDVLMQKHIASKCMQGWAQPEGEPGWGWHPRLTVRVNGQPRGSFVACTSSSEGEAGSKEGSSRVEFHGAVPILAEVSLPYTHPSMSVSHLG